VHIESCSLAKIQQTRVDIIRSCKMQPRFLCGVQRARKKWTRTTQEDADHDDADRQRCIELLKNSRSGTACSVSKVKLLNIVESEFTRIGNKRIFKKKIMIVETT
jgi:hypothetical protein